MSFHLDYLLDLPGITALDLLLCQESCLLAIEDFI